MSVRLRASPHQADLSRQSGQPCRAPLIHLLHVCMTTWEVLCHSEKQTKSGWMGSILGKVSSTLDVSLELLALEVYSKRAD
jgi:hypothetical protein